jgi:hypothetical protein
MKSEFTHKGHKIVVDKRLSGIKLIVDEKVCSEEKEFFKMQNTDYDLLGTATNADGSVDEVKVAFSHGLFVDHITVYYAGEEIGNTQIL